MDFLSEFKSMQFLQGIELLNGFYGDWKSLFKRQSIKDEEYYFNELIKRINSVSVIGIETALRYRPNDIEKLSGVNNIYAFTFRGKKAQLNLRVLFHLKNDDFIIISTCFSEKNKNDYSRNINKAKERLRDYLRRDKNG